MALTHAKYVTVCSAAAGTLLALALVAAPFGLAACSSNDSAAPSQASSQPSDTSAEDVEQETIEWADECTDRRGDATCYAVAELDGMQLESFLLSHGYVWSERNLMWVKEDGSSSFTVLDAEGVALTNIQVEELDAGALTKDVSYRLVTSGYSSARRAFAALAGNIMPCDDSEIVDESGAAIVTSTTGNRLFVFVSTSNDTHVITVLSQDAVAEGLLNKIAGRELGTTVEEAFAALVGREPAKPEQP